MSSSSTPNRSESPSLVVEAIALSKLRAKLITLEESIIFGMLERAQWKRNEAMYRVGALATTTDGSLANDSFFDFMLKETERVHSLCRRYTSPEEHPFFIDAVQRPLLPLLNFKTTSGGGVVPNAINLNALIRRVYSNFILPAICEAGDDRNYGSAAQSDIGALQALSSRIHAGKFVAEAKFQADVERYTRLIGANDADGIMEALTNADVERQVLERIRLKATTYGLGPAQLKRVLDTLAARAGGGEQAFESAAAGSSESSSSRQFIDPEVVVRLYREHVIPMTKQVQVEYLLRRLDGMKVAFLGPETTFTHQAAIRFFGGGAGESPASQANYEPRDSIPKIFQAVLSNEVTYGVVPVANSGTGNVAATIDELVQRDRPETALQVVGEIFLPIEQTLMAPRGVRLEDIERIYSHPQAIKQCSNFLELKLRDASPVTTSSTAAAARAVAEGIDRASAAIASPLAAEHFDLDIVAPSIQNRRTGNVTRFFVISKSRVTSSPTGSDRTLILFGVDDQPGGLFAALRPFHSHAINLFSIQAYKNPVKAWEHNFIVELVGHQSDPNVADALAELNQHATFVTTLGSWSSNSIHVQRTLA
jgi:chorismate mutase